MDSTPGPPSPSVSPPIDYMSRGADRPLPVRYMPQLDALRALAVMAVWIEHWEIKELPGFRLIPWGSFGVWLFFVLSGFLITGILLRARDASDRSPEGGLWPVLRSFYARRFLRILPIYYLTLFVAVVILKMPRVREVFWWHFAYATNFRLALARPFPAQGGLHLWTLAVEEQFYVLWPVLILLVPKRHLLKTIFITLGSGVAFRAICVSIGQRGAAGVWPFACLDLFAFGAALAIFGQDMHLRPLGAAFTRWCGVLGLPALIALLIASASHNPGATQHRPELVANLLFNSLAAGAVFAWLIAGAARGFGGSVKAVLEFRPLLFLGKISYGLYIYHNFIPGLLDRQHLVSQHLVVPASMWARFGVRALLTVLVATASWYLIEKPLSWLKRYFEYASGPAIGQSITISQPLLPASRLIAVA